MNAKETFQKNLFTDSYIVILANIPTIKNEQDGMIQREIAIDVLFRDIPRVYVDKIYRKVPFRYLVKNWLRDHYITRKPPVKQLRSASVKIIHYIAEDEVYPLLKEASCIYVHSLYKLDCLPREYLKEFKDKIILDVHGCVVEENIYDHKSPIEVDKLQKLETYAFQNVHCLIAVTRSMVNFYQQKYSGLKTKFIVLPIFTKAAKRRISQSSEAKLTLVYSGGLQRYQNVDLMLDTIRKIQGQCRVKILTQKVRWFNQLTKKAHLKITYVKRVPSYKMPKEYEDCDMGFVLRENIVVNLVACPTKLVEYITYGIVPIVLSPKIGDFCELSYSYVLNTELIEGNFPSQQEISRMRTNNYRVLDQLDTMRKKGEDELLKTLICLIEDRKSSEQRFVT